MVFSKYSIFFNILATHLHTSLSYILRILSEVHPLRPSKILNPLEYHLTAIVQVQVQTSSHTLSHLNFVGRRPIRQVIRSKYVSPGVREDSEYTMT